MRNTKKRRDEKTVKNIIQDSIQQIAQSGKAAAGTSAATTGSGVATWLEWIPSDIGKLATVIGISLSLVLIFTHLKKHKRDEEQHKAQMKYLRNKLKP